MKCTLSSRRHKKKPSNQHLWDFRDSFRSFSAHKFRTEALRDDPNNGCVLRLGKIQLSSFYLNSHTRGFQLYAEILGPPYMKQAKTII